MVQVRVAGIAVDADGDHVLLLKPLDALPGEGRILPIWIGAQEATSILLAVEGADPLIADPPAVLGVDLSERHVVGLRGGVQLHRHADQAEGDRALPDRSHASSVSALSPNDASATPRTPRPRCARGRSRARP